MTGPDDRPGWSVTWLLRIQRRARTKPRPTPANGKGGTGFQWFSWTVVLLLITMISVLVWMGVLPR